ncbi:hypothetical protein M3Y97_00979100 [Aphelenchoides bicaudatus]|nr:hypothetical protein M3Y97_00979100 [Aphelenchoides bicaudatus]
MDLLLAALLSPLFVLPIWFVVQCGKKGAKRVPPTATNLAQHLKTAEAAPVKSLAKVNRNQANKKDRTVKKAVVADKPEKKEEDGDKPKEEIKDDNKTAKKLEEKDEKALAEDEAKKKEIMAREDEDTMKRVESLKPELSEP